jgi:hypothetical protein
MGAPALVTTIKRSRTEMKRIRIVGLALVAVFALSAVAASAAFAGSEFLNESNASPAGITVTGKGGLATFESTGGAKVVCNKSESTGTFKSALEATALVKYSGECKLTSSLANSTCAEPIETKELKVLAGSKVGTNATRLEVFLPASNELNAPVAEFTCGSVKVKVTGGVICKNNKFALSLTGEVECKQISAGKQEFTEALSWGEKGEELDIKDSLEAESTLSIFKLLEADAQTTTEELKFSSKVAQTEGA